MTKGEYIELYKQWTMSNDLDESKLLCRKIADGALDELVKLDNIYNKYHASYKSPVFQRGDYVCLSAVDRVQLVSMCLCELKLSLHTNCSEGWTDIIVNVKWFGDEGRKNLEKSLLKEELEEYADNISAKEDDIKLAREEIDDMKKKQAALEEQLRALESSEQ